MDEHDSTGNRALLQKRKQSLHIPESMQQEIENEARRLERSMSWVVQRAWRHARGPIRAMRR